MSKNKPALRQTKNRYRAKQSSFDPILSRGIIAIILVIFAVVIILSFFDQAGPLGFLLNEGLLSFLFGSIRYTTPFIIAVIAWFFVKDVEYDYRATHGAGAILFFLTLSSLFHIGYPSQDMWVQAILGNGGGIFGMLAWPLKTYLGSIAAIVILVGLATVSILLIFNTLIVHLLMLNKKLIFSLGSIGKNFVKIITAIFVTEKEINSHEEENYEEDYPSDSSEHEENEWNDEFDPETDSLSEEELDHPKIISHRLQDQENDEEDETVEEKKSQKAWEYKAIIKALPPLSLLSNKRGKPTSGDIKANMQIIQGTLKEFGIDVEMGEARVGPTVTRYTLKPNKGMKLSRIVSLSNDLSLALAAHPIRIEAPIPGKSLVGIEVPNEKTALVSFQELLGSKEFKNREHNMMIALGKDVAGKVWFADLPKMPHLLIAGATGSGKTVCVNTIIMSLLYQNTAETLRMIMIDPKRIELTLYNGIPHLLTPVITNMNKTVNALKWTTGEMERRFEVLATAKSRDLDSYNEKFPNDKIPHIIFVVDELADLMATAAGDVEAGVIRLAQMARAVGIHLILATQRPSVDVITGLMKANIPGRIAFSLPSLIDSRTILDTSGAEKLLGRGDMLHLTAALSKPVRIQGSFISEQELVGVVNYLRGDETPEYDDSIVEKQDNSGTLNMFGGPSDDQDALFAEAKVAIMEAGKASASLLQRRLKIGYARAARILDEMEASGIIGPADGAKPREILITEYETDNTLTLNQNDVDEYEIKENNENEEFDNEEEYLDKNDNNENEPSFKKALLKKKNHYENDVLEENPLDVEEEDLADKDEEGYDEEEKY